MLAYISHGKSDRNGHLRSDALQNRFEINGIDDAIPRVADISRYLKKLRKITGQIRQKCGAAGQKNPINLQTALILIQLEDILHFIDDRLQTVLDGIGNAAVLLLHTNAEVELELLRSFEIHVQAVADRFGDVVAADVQSPIQNRYAFFDETDIGRRRS